MSGTKPPHMRDAEAVERKIAQMVAAGPEQLQIIVDFDQTLTRFRVDGKRSHSTHAVVGSSELLSEEFRAASKELHDKYYPIEIDPAIGHEEKLQSMIRWWTETHELFVQHGLCKQHLAEMVKSPMIQLRDGAEDLLASAHAHNVPVHIFSAGLYDVIHAFLDDRNLAQYHAHVVSNQMVFDDSGKVTGFKGTLIHTLNKNSSAIKVVQPWVGATEFSYPNQPPPSFDPNKKESEGWERVKARGSVLLLGDNLGDVGMAEGLEPETILKIGFLNDRIEERKEAFAETYDMVLLDDSSFAPVNDIFARIAGQKDTKK